MRACCRPTGWTAPGHRYEYRGRNGFAPDRFAVPAPAASYCVIHCVSPVGHRVTGHVSEYEFVRVCVFELACASVGKRSKPPTAMVPALCACVLSPNIQLHRCDARVHDGMRMLRCRHRAAFGELGSDWLHRVGGTSMHRNVAPVLPSHAPACPIYPI